MTGRHGCDAWGSVGAAEAAEALGRSTPGAGQPRGTRITRREGGAPGTAHKPDGKFGFPGSRMQAIGVWGRFGGAPGPSAPPPAKSSQWRGARLATCTGSMCPPPESEGPPGLGVGSVHCSLPGPPGTRAHSSSGRPRRPPHHAAGLPESRAAGWCRPSLRSDAAAPAPKLS